MTNVHRWHLVATTPAAAAWVRGLVRTIAAAVPELRAERDDGSTTCRRELAAAADPAGPAVAWCCSWAGPEAMRAVLEPIEAGGRLPAGVHYARVAEAGPGEGMLRASNVPRLAARLAGRQPGRDAVRGDMVTLLSALGLAFRIEN